MESLIKWTIGVPKEKEDYLVINRSQTGKLTITTMYWKSDNVWPIEEEYVKYIVAHCKLDDIRFVE